MYVGGALSLGGFLGVRSLGVGSWELEVESTRDVCVTGGTGYIGQQLVPALLMRGHRVRVVARAASIGRVPAGATRMAADVLSEGSLAAALRPEDTVIHLVGTPHPNPAKAAEFERVDLTSIRALVAAIKRVPIRHLIYVSVAQPAPIMRAYLEVRAEGERLIRDAHIPATVLRPWYVLGPGRRWPVVLVPVYWIAERIPRFRPGAQRLGLVTIEQFVAALVNAVDDPPELPTVRIVDVPRIREARLRVDQTRTARA
jgi:uncharacterized protein YbjT (DUF2867 family)